jgi:hypothetical protein
LVKHSDILGSGGQSRASASKGGEEANQDFVHVNSMHGNALAAKFTATRAVDQYSRNLNRSNNSQVCDKPV